MAFPAETVAHPTRPESISFENIFANITGQETAPELDALAAQINHHHQQMKVGDLLPPSPVFPYNFTSQRLTQLFHRISQADLPFTHQEALITVAPHLFPFKQFLNSTQNALTHTPIERAGSILYLLNHIDNPFQTYAPTTTHLYHQALELTHNTKSPLFPNFNQSQLIQSSINMLVTTATRWVSAWSYFGPHRAQSILELFTHPQYAQSLIRDFYHFAALGKILSPAQLYALLHYQPDFDHPDPSTCLRQLYDKGSSLSKLADKSGLTYQISGLNRAYEYPNLKSLIPDRYRHGPMLSIGGQLGLIEVLRAQELDYQGLILIIDQLPLEECLPRALVLKNELTYTPDHPSLSPEEVLGLLQASPVPIHYLHATYPTPPDQLQQHLNSLVTHPDQTPSVIFDQRATALYQDGQDALTSIRTSLSLLGLGGVFIYTRGFANLLITDIVVEVSPDGTHASLKMLQHTSNFFSESTPLIKGDVIPSDITFAEGWTRQNSSGNFDPHQKDRLSTALEAQQQLVMIKLIGSVFCQKYHTIIHGNEPSNSFSHLIAYAYATTQELPLYIDVALEIDQIPEYIQIMSRLSAIIDLSLSQLEKLSQIEPFPPSELLPGLTQSLNRFLDRIKSDPTRYLEGLAWLNTTFNTAHQPATFTPIPLPYTILAPAPKSQLFPLPESLSDQFRSQFIRQFFLKFAYPNTGTYATLVADAFLVAYNLAPDIPNAKVDSLTPEYHSDYQYIIHQIAQQLSLITLGHSPTWDFSQLNHPEYFRSALSVITSVPTKTWRQGLHYAARFFSIKDIQGA